MQENPWYYALTTAGGIIIGVVGNTVVAIIKARAVARKEAQAVQHTDQQFQASQYQRLIDNLQRSVDKLTGDINAMRTEHLQEINTLRGEHLKCQEENAHLTARVEMLENQVAALKGQGQK